MCVNYLFFVGILIIYFYFMLREENIKDRGDLGYKKLEMSIECIYGNEEIRVER